MRARYYDPEVGRFISEDPSGFGGGINLYAYVLNNPILYVDPSGLQSRRHGRMNTGEAMGSALGQVGDFFETLSDIRLLKESMAAVSEFEATIPQGQQVEAFLLIDPISKRVKGVVDRNVGAITNSPTDVYSMVTTGTKRIEIRSSNRLKSISTNNRGK